MKELCPRFFKSEAEFVRAAIRDLIEKLKRIEGGHERRMFGS